MQTSRPDRILSPWDLATLIGLVALAGFWIRMAPRLPDPLPTHFDAMGRINGWTAKAQVPWLIFGAPLFLWLVLFLIGVAGTWLPTGSAGGRPVPIHPLRGMLGLGMCLLMAGCVVVPLAGRTTLFSGLLGFALCLVLGLVFLCRDLWQAYAAAPRSPHLRGGMLYVNREDPRLWVEKRVGAGWTLNYAHPAAIWVTLLILAAIPALLLLVRALAR